MVPYLVPAPFLLLVYLNAISFHNQQPAKQRQTRMRGWLKRLL